MHHVDQGTIGDPFLRVILEDAPQQVDQLLRVLEFGLDEQFVEFGFVDANVVFVQNLFMDVGVDQAHFESDQPNVENIRLLLVFEGLGVFHLQVGEQLRRQIFQRRIS